MAEVRVVGTVEEIRAVAAALGAVARMRRRRDGGAVGYLSVDARRLAPTRGGDGHDRR